MVVFGVDEPVVMVNLGDRELGPRGQAQDSDGLAMAEHQNAVLVSILNIADPVVAVEIILILRQGRPIRVAQLHLELEELRIVLR